MNKNKIPAIIAATALVLFTMTYNTVSSIQAQRQSIKQEQETARELERQKEIIKDLEAKVEEAEAQYKKETEQVPHKQESAPVIDIRADYEAKCQEFYKIANKREGIPRITLYKIKALSEYDTSSSTEAARIVYQLSDEMLNGMYKQYKSWGQFTQEMDKAQLSWIRDKENYEKTTQDSDLNRYNYLKNITLRKCYDWFMEIEGNYSDFIKSIIAGWQ